MSADYDFIIVGGGAAGGALTYFLAQSSKKPRILLLEAGAQNSDGNLRVDGQRWLTFLNKDMNYGYKTVPQQDAAGRELDYSRGRGLGGSSAINFGVFTVGAQGDYDEWARVVSEDDDSDPGFFSWEHMQARLRKLETFHDALPSSIANGSKYVSPRPENHGTSGPLHVGYAGEWEDDVVPWLDLYLEAGYPLNPDHNSGNPIGMSPLISSAHNGKRSTSRDLLVQLESLDNVTILTDSPVQRVILDTSGADTPTKAIGVESNGKGYLAAKEVVLCAGALDTPRILMHSGIGPADQLDKFGIPVVVASPAVGSGLRDHAFCPLVYLRRPESVPNYPTGSRAALYSDQAVMDAALEQWKRDGTGPWAKIACQAAIGFFKFSDAFTASSEFQALPDAEKAHLSHPTVPHYEVFTHFPISFFMPEAFPAGIQNIDKFNYQCLLVFLYNAQSRGEVRLQSSDPNVPLLFDPKFLGVEFDRRAAVEALREALKVVKSPAYAKDTLSVVAEPPNAASATDEELLAYWRQTISSSWHMTGTVKMGKKGDADAAVDSGFRVIGVDGLRVADMSVLPVLLSGHTQAGAYLTGTTAAEKLISDFDL
ncbi:hypothetical protein B0H66DRAFT_632378 [Apodospora peruviana]|uniref:Glucose-methanol-choline oxidoreductase N-terminal domain-containing protein n=1 Tax=Apodospora peruviana TaxID=516989 RepID=A0AAE0HUS8_9PEZI|nr:hypothetical protein B0H66DRAFT_632378 [Apodospora peruviana]